MEETADEWWRLADQAQRAGKTDEALKALKIAEELDKKPNRGIVDTIVRTPLSGFAQMGGALSDMALAGVNALAEKPEGPSTSFMPKPPLVGPVLRALGYPAEPRGRETLTSAINKPAEVVGQAINWAQGDKTPARKDALAYGSLEELPPSHRPVAAALETFTNSMIPAAGVFGAIGAGSKAAGPMMRFASQNPTKFLAGEAAMSAGAGQGAFLAETIDPGDSSTRALFEIGGTVFTPVALISKLSQKLFNSGTNLIPPIRTERAKAVVADTITNYVQQSGFDPGVIAKSLLEVDPNGLVLSPAHASGNQALLDLQEAVVKKFSPKASGAIDAAKKEALDELRILSDAMASSGDPNKVKAAAKLRKTYFTKLLEGRVGKTVAEAEAARSKFPPANKVTEGKMVAGQTAAKSLDDAWKEAGSVERSLYDKVDLEEVLPLDSLLAAEQRARDLALPTDALDPSLERILKALKPKAAGDTYEISVGDELREFSLTPGKPVVPTVGLLQKIRSRALDIGRAAAASGDRTTAKQMDEIANGVRDTFEKIDDPALAVAREFSKAKHDVFTRTFAGNVLSKTGEGGEKIVSPMVLQRAFGSNGIQGDVNFGALREASAFPQPGEASTAMRGAQEQFLRADIGDLRNTATGAFQPRGVLDYAATNTPTMKDFPGVGADVSGLAGAESRLVDAEKFSKTATAVAERELAKVLGFDDPTVAIGRALQGKTPYTDFSLIAKTAARGGPEALKGLKSAVVRNAIEKATTGQDLSFVALRDELTRPISSGKDSLLAALLRNKAMTNDEYNKILQTLDRGADLQTMSGKAENVEQLLNGPAVLTENIAKLMGARIGALLGRGTGATLRTSAQGSQLAGSIVDKLPTEKARKILVETIQDKALMAQALQRGRIHIAKPTPVDLVNGAVLQSFVPKEEYDRKRMGRELRGAQ